MKREDLKRIVPEITDEQIDAVLNLRSAEIEKINKDMEDLKAQIEAKEAEITDYKGTIFELEKASGDAEELNKKIQELQAAIADREEADKQAATEKALGDRFSSVAGECKFVNDFTKNGIYAEFKAALDADENKGKSDADIYAAITKDRSGIFENPNPISVTGGSTNRNLGTMEDDQIRAVMGLPASH